MLRFYVAFDDTDTPDCGRGTGKLARWYMDRLPRECIPWGVVRQQLLNSPRIPMTSHNSSLCCVIDAPDSGYRQLLIEKASTHISENFFEGSDPGLCLASESDHGLQELIDFALRCCSVIVSREEAIEAASKVHLSGHGGTNGGIIGAAAAVGLTLLGESGRLVSYRDIREVPRIVRAAELRQREIYPVSANRHAEYIPDDHQIDTLGSLRPHLSGKRVVLPLLSTGKKSWQCIPNEKVIS